ncbi:MAG TPA: MarR family winged helix-turn-helix transcriptional regulator [Burkholderiaceae bacterium]|nr:MarR family winged helix-turn-helix transcriptional regulator [Burkholderiaceae bacterium]
MARAESTATTDYRPPDLFVDDYLPALLAQASLLISSEFHRVVRQRGLSIAEWRVLASLADGRAVSTGRLAQLVLGKQPTVTRQLDRMARKGYVERVDDNDDRRITLVRITPTGQKAVARLIPLARAHESRVLEPFGRKHAEDFKGALRRMIELHRPAPAEAAGDEAGIVVSPRIAMPSTRRPSRVQPKEITP